MTTIFETQQPREHIVLRGVSWSYYEQTLHEIGNQPMRVAFLDGAMELMPPLPEHESRKIAAHDLIVALADENDLPLKCFGATTFRHEERAAGSEPDDCFYLNEIDSVKGMKRFDPSVHRAPDLWVEVDLTSPSVPREPICARLGVPEIWRLGYGRVTVRLLTSAGVYVDSATSLAFPSLPMSGFAEFVSRMDDDDETATLREFRKWLQSLPRPE